MKRRRSKFLFPRLRARINARQICELDLTRQHANERLDGAGSTLDPRFEARPAIPLFSECHAAPPHPSLPLAAAASDAPAGDRAKLRSPPPRFSHPAARYCAKLLRRAILVPPVPAALAGRSTRSWKPARRRGGSVTSVPPGPRKAALPAPAPRDDRARGPIPEPPWAAPLPPARACRRRQGPAPPLSTAAVAPPAGVAGARQHSRCPVAAPIGRSAPLAASAPRPG